LTLAAIAEATNIGPGRALRILRGGAVPDVWERDNLVGVLGDESPTAKSDGGCLQSAPVVGTYSTASRSCSGLARRCFCDVPSGGRWRCVGG
jgi:hypothetical protein